MAQIQTLPGAFPLHEDREFLTESEWVILKLLCRPIGALVDMEPGELSAASGGQISLQRCRDLIHIVCLSRLPGLGTWIARIMVEAGWDEHAVRTRPAGEIMEKINRHAGYTICNQASIRALAELQTSWAEAPAIIGAE